MTDAPHSEHPYEPGDPGEPAASAPGAPDGTAPPAPGRAVGVVRSAPLAPGAPDAGAGPGEPAGAVRLTAWVRGRVQGVGFRWFTRATALRIGGLTGYASNLGDGRVQVVAEGARAGAEALLDWLRHGDTPGRVDGVSELWGPARGGYTGFETR